MVNNPLRSFTPPNYHVGDIMILDQMLHAPKMTKEMVIDHLSKELNLARLARPMPHLAHRTGLTFSEQMLARRIVPSLLGATTDEIRDLEHAGVQLTIQNALKSIFEGDLLLDHVPVLIRHVYVCLKRYHLTLDTFHISDTQLREREYAYWHEHGRRFVEALKKTDGVRESTDVRVWYLLEIRHAMIHHNMHGVRILRSNLGLDHTLSLFSVRRIHHELTRLSDEAHAPGLDPLSAKQKEQHYNTLMLFMRADFIAFSS